ncbi:hypothetical protein PoB_000339000 [Plakobranchus ocellatus]|uniref:Uncharacterized protein n=1 Tax=Plakobranchus ocellatus TaxID=259542 RepID=A0AAV3Y2L7_9GAST|nr:hypothetical protein PoB_000339000 [Plakobranchus ocellatus]
MADKLSRRTDVIVIVLYPTPSWPDNLRNETGHVVRAATAWNRTPRAMMIPASLTLISLGVCSISDTGSSLADKPHDLARAGPHPEIGQAVVDFPVVIFDRETKIGGEAVPDNGSFWKWLGKLKKRSAINVALSHYSRDGWFNLLPRPTIKIYCEGS